MPGLNKIQQSFIAMIAAGATLPDALDVHVLKWGTVAAWRRWTPGFRTAHNRALKTGVPKRNLLRMVERLLTSYGSGFILAPDLVQLAENYTRARGRALRECALLCPLDEKMHRQHRK